MQVSHLFTKTLKQAPKDEVSKNAQLLLQAGFIHKEMAGVYTLLPLGKRVVDNIIKIIAEEMNAIGGQQVQMTALQDRSIWETSGRWSDDEIDVWFKSSLHKLDDIGFAPTHEEPIARMMSQYISSYRDLPVSVYQFQTKFRKELRAKSGIMRGREFLMKDLYSFHPDQESFDTFYDDVRTAYDKVYDRLGIGDHTYYTYATGGMFSEFSHEFQTVSEAGEDTILIDKDLGIAFNNENGLITDELLQSLNTSMDKLEEASAIEVGNIFPLGTKYAKAMNVSFKNPDGDVVTPIMGSYGIGVTRLMGTIAELYSDDKGLVWPESVAPFTYILVPLGDSEEVQSTTMRLYDELRLRQTTVLLDDRDAGAGQKLSDSELLGIPHRIVISNRSLEQGGVEVTSRSDGGQDVITVQELLERI